MTENGRKSSSVAKAFELMQLIADAGADGVGLQPLAARAGVAVSTVHRYTASLLELGMIERNANGCFRLGVGLVTLAGRYLEDDLLRTVAHPFLVELAEVSGETAHLGVPIGNRLVYVDKVESAKSVRLVSRIGSQVPMHCTSMGKALMALMPPEQRDALLAGDLDRPTERTRVGADLLAELDRVRAQGFALDDEENEDGVRCIGLAVVNAAGDPVGAFSVSAPAGRFSVEDCHRLAPKAMAIAARITDRIGYTGGPRRTTL
ncbi:DNA-binding IclR family transcriptional regulator [Mumia flava]|uniref:DNA-binding IclR family transcriptional regulator n=1 Tax=Mumia flava TaxID=1348852 RepID=A0A0B2BVA3_9ACTN|nr:IclR family transcriptional regulator [Mumia flava]PJJ58112.1 DNA-binding IclR family transcriptional regulator [Mumia flava]